MKFGHLKLRVLQGQYEYVLFKNRDDMVRVLNQLPDDRPAAFFFGSDEASAILPHGVAEKGAKTESDWSCLRVVGEMPFGTVQGLIATVSSSLKNEGVGICVVSTFLTDWFFVKSNHLKKAISILKKSGWEFAD